MRIHFDVPGAKRKCLVGALSEVLSLPMNYLGAPTFAYQIGEYTIEKAGLVTGPDDSDLIAVLCGQRRFETISREYDTESYPDIDQHHPGQYANPDAPLTEAMIRQMEEGQILNLTTADTDNTTDLLVIEMPLTGFTPDKLENLYKLVNAKTSLLKAAFGVKELPIQRTDEDGGKLRFPWMLGGLAPEAVDAYTRFIAALCDMAKEQQRVTAKEKPVDNAKYAFRCFLLRLGFIGDEYKQARKTLLRNLSGNGSFRNGCAPKHRQSEAM